MKAPTNLKGEGMKRIVLVGLVVVGMVGLTVAVDSYQYVRGVCKIHFMCDTRLRVCRACGPYDDPDLCSGSCQLTKIYKNGHLYDQYCQDFGNEDCNGTPGDETP